MPDELGTEENGTPVAPSVAADEGDEETVEQLKARLKAAESQIGRQNNLHGQRKQEADEQLKAMRAELDALKYERFEEEQRRRFAAMTPLEQSIELAKQANARAAATQAELARRDAQVEIDRKIDDLLREASKRGLDTTKIRTSSLEEAVLDYQAAKNEQLEEQLSELRARVDETRADAQEAARVASGGRRIASGSPPAGAGQSKLPDEVRQLMADYGVAKKRKDGASAIGIAARLGELGYTTRQLGL